MKSVEVTYTEDLSVDFAEEPGEGGYASVAFTEDNGEDVELVAEDRAGLRNLLTALIAAIPEGDG